MGSQQIQGDDYICRILIVSLDNTSKLGIHGVLVPGN